MVAVFLWLLSIEIMLPAEVVSVSKMVRTDRGFVFLDARAQALWQFNQGQQPALIYDRKGSGPGEYGRLFGLRHFDQRFYLVDMHALKFIVLNRLFQLEREIKVQHLPRDVLHLGDHLYLVYPKAGVGMVHRHDAETGKPVSFGSLIGDPKRLGFESGQVLAYDGLIFYVHHFLPQLEVFQPDGKLVKRILLPGFESGPLVENVQRGNLIQPRYRYTIDDLFAYKQKILLKLHNHQQPKAWLYVFDPRKQEFTGRFWAPWQMVSDGAGGMYLVDEDETSGRLTLKTIVPDDRDL